MSNLVPFIQKLESDPALQARVDTLLAGSPADARADFLALSAELGHPLTEEDLRTLVASAELSEGELGSVAGGGVFDNVVGSINSWAARTNKRIVNLLVPSDD
jgi:predicted ribosomally synthesized peptide with nif11-like leader